MFLQFFNNLLKIFNNSLLCVDASNMNGISKIF